MHIYMCIFFVRSLVYFGGFYTTYDIHAYIHDKHTHIYIWIKIYMRMHIDIRTICASLCTYIHGTYTYVCLYVYVYMYTWLCVWTRSFVIFGCVVLYSKCKAKLLLDMCTCVCMPCAYKCVYAMGCKIRKSWTKLRIQRQFPTRPTHICIYVHAYIHIYV